MYIATALVEKQIYIHPSLNLALLNVDFQVLSFLIHYLLKFKKQNRFLLLNFFLKTTILTFACKTAQVSFS